MAIDDQPNVAVAAPDGPAFAPGRRRTWNLYLAYCEAGFAARYLDVNQFLLTR